MRDNDSPLLFVSLAASSSSAPRNKLGKQEKKLQASQVVGSAVSNAIAAALGKQMEDKEADKMADAAKRMMKVTFGSPALRSIRFTVGPEETEAFEKRQEQLKEQGKPYCSKVDRNLGLITSVYLWTEISHNREEWLTHLQLSRPDDPDGPLYKDLGPEGWVSFTHEVGGGSAGGKKR